MSASLRPADSLNQLRAPLGIPNDSISSKSALIAAITALPPEGLCDFRKKVACYPLTFCDEGQPTKSSAMLFAAIVSDLRLLEARG